MVFLAITSKGFADATQAASKTGEAVWCGADAVSEEEFDAAPMENVSRFVYGLRGENSSLIADAVATISEHHPGESVWVEALQE
jgi:hypothetical protein